MSEVAEFVPTTIPPQQREPHHSRLPPNFIGKAALAIKLLLTSASALRAQETSIPPPSTLAVADDTPSEINAEPSSLVREWVASKGGTTLKDELKKAVEKLKDPSFAERQKATVEILKLLEKLQEIMYPFPEDFREILGEGLFPSDMYGEHRRKSLREEDDFSPEQSYRLDTIQNKWQSDNFSTIPSIMPGTYSTEGLRLALQKQGGLNIVVEKQPHKYFAISQHENKWPDCLEMLRVVGGGHVHYVSESNTIFIDNDAGAFRPTMFEGTNIIVERRSPFVNGTITEMTNLPSLGRFMIPINFSGQSERFIGLTGVKDADLVGLNCSCTRNSDHEIEETFEEIRIDTLVGSPVRSKVIPFDTDVVLGKHQVICATKREHQSQWIVSIKIRILEPISHESPYDMSSDPIWEVARRNKYTFLKDDDTATYLMKPREGEPPWDAAITFTLQNEPKKVKVSYIPDVYMKTIRLP